MYRIGFARRFPREVGHRATPSSLDKYLFPFTAFIKAFSLNHHRNFDAIWAIMANYAGFAALFFKMFNPKIYYILTLQEGDPIAHIKKRVGFFHPIFKKIFTKADHIQTISTHLRKFALGMGYTGPIDVIPNGVDLIQFAKNYSEYDLRVIKRILGKKQSFEKNGTEFSNPNTSEQKSNDIFLITTSRLVRKNAVSDIIKSLNHLPVSIKLLILGIGPELQSLKDLVDQENLADRVMFLGHAPHSDIPLYLKASNIFVRPSLSEGLGNSFIEAMAAGIPVIATSVGGITDFLKDRETGLFCEMHNPKSIADKVNLLINNHDLKIKLVNNAKALISQKYDWNIIARDMESKVFNRQLK